MRSLRFFITTSEIRQEGFPRSFYTTFKPKRGLRNSFKLLQKQDRSGPLKLPTKKIRQTSPSFFQTTLKTRQISPTIFRTPSKKTHVVLDTLSNYFKNKTKIQVNAVYTKVCKGLDQL